MSETVATSRVRIINPQGLHARPADLFVKLANRFESVIEVVKDGERVDGKSILAILTLAALQGTELSIEARGRDADEALRALVELVEQGFVEDQQVNQETGQ
jgi:phosphotransferase system HPr (HPr) family protein